MPHPKILLFRKTRIRVDEQGVFASMTFIRLLGSQRIRLHQIGSVCLTPVVRSHRF